jgi:hypothetical protein
MKEFFSIGSWINRLNKYYPNASNSFTTNFFLILIIPVVLVGFIGGSPLVSAKILINNDEDILVSLIIFLGLIALSIALMPFAVKELIKIVALIQVED